MPGRPTTDQPPDEPPSLYAWAGGRDAIHRLVNAFYDRVERDDLLGGLFPGGVSDDHRDHVERWWVEVFGGPADYTPHGGYRRMVDHHVGLRITPEQRFRFASLMSLAPPYTWSAQTFGAARIPSTVCAARRTSAQTFGRRGRARVSRRGRGMSWPRRDRRARGGCQLVQGVAPTYSPG